MRRLLLITGDLATGKTTFSNALSARYGAAVLQKDRIKEVLGDEIGVLFERYCRRMTRENRHPVHLSAPLHVQEEFRRYVLDARREAVPGETIGIDATDFSYQTDEALLEKIDAFMR